MKLWKFSGTFLTVTGIIHTVVAILLGHDVYLGIIQNGLINSINDDPMRAFAWWFLICGIILIILGQTLQSYIKKCQRPAPLFLGYSLLVFSIIGCIVDPISGMWLFIPQALIIILANKR